MRSSPSSSAESVLNFINQEFSLSLQFVAHALRFSSMGHDLCETNTTSSESTAHDYLNPDTLVLLAKGKE